MRFVAGLLLFITCYTAVYGSGCESNVLRKCFDDYRGILVKRPSYDRDHCSRVQEVVNCFSQNPSCKGATLDRFRLWILQESALEKSLGLCRNVAYQKLSNALIGTAYENEEIVDKYARHPPTTCSIEIQETCNREFFKLVRNEKRICRNAQIWFRCYTRELRKGKHKSCPSQIIRKYRNFVEKHGPHLVDDAIRMANLC